TLGAWVAEAGGEVAGHVLLTDAGEGAASIKRLFVAPAARGHGLGGALFDAACAEAVARGLRPELVVAETDRAAIRLYERGGWRLVAREPWDVNPEIGLLRFVPA